MKRPILIGAMIASAAVMTASLPLFAADPQPWPWKSKLPPDPALVELASVEGITVVINKSNPPTVAITVNASAPTPGFSEFQLTPRMGDPKDLIFAFDAKTGKLTTVGHQSHLIKTPRNFAVDPTGKYLLAASQKIEFS